MSDFKYWISNIRSAIELIASEDAFKKAWLLRDQTVTSAYNAEELLEQVLGDLELEQNVKVFKTELRNMGIETSISKFTTALLAVEESLKLDPKLNDPARMLQSNEWLRLREAARDVQQQITG